MRAFFLATVALAGAHGVAAAVQEPPRPDMAEWKETKSAEAEKAAGVVAKDAKMSAVGKVVELLAGLQQKVLAEGEEEAHTYSKFACFCKDTTKEKLESIQKGEDSKASLSADIAELGSKRDGLDTKIGELLAEIAKEKHMTEQFTELRQKNLATYEANAADLTGALDALEGAIQKLKASKKPSFVQIQAISETLRTAALLAETLGLGGDAASQALAMLQQEPANEVQMEDYNFHSNPVIMMLERLQKQFRGEKEQIDKNEVEEVGQYNQFVQGHTDLMKAAQHNLLETKKKKEAAIESIASASQELTTVEAALMDDKSYTNTLSSMCSEKAKTWDQRTNLRAAELSTLTQAIGIIKGAVAEKTSAATIRFAQQGMTLRLAKAVASDAPAMQAIEAEAEAAEDAPAFVQVQQKALLATTRRHLAASKPDDSTQAVVNLLRTEGAHLKSALLTSLASKIAGDPFGKVKALIQELIERLLQESANESSQKGWCDKSNSDAGQKRDYAAEEVRTLNSEMAKLEAKRDSLAASIEDLNKEIVELKEARATAETERAEEKTENGKTIEEAQAGLDALNDAITLIDRFYKSSQKEAVDLSLAQQDPSADAPDAGFDNGEAYKGAQSESGGILGMLEVMKSDFVRTVEQTQVEEMKAQQEHLEFMTASGKSLAEKEEAEKETGEQHQDTVSTHGEATESLAAQTTILTTALTELIQLKPVCQDTGMSYSDRVAMREEEIAALNKAMCILTKYQEFGPDAASGEC
mmetsp:Transcript_104584/g.337091  ORF Transcript_104584/g.337091 Transcript_104584/m.337091 type:complete len:757 (+) Transcript_104584:57-2327(+)